MSGFGLEFPLVATIIILLIWKIKTMDKICKKKGSAFGSVLAKLSIMHYRQILEIVAVQATLQMLGKNYL